ncbi:MAG: Nif3-like dinuclear metal center hexameric protein [Bacteroidetes bacterium]|nr:Nif3-like dinuclear metal center hexameric protein [Bacteroidota bacterium]
MITGLDRYKTDYTIQEVIDIILKEIPGAPLKQTVDTIKSGDANNKVTSIVSTMFATIDTIKATAKLGANFIIAHEPTFYNHEDDTNYVPNNSIVKQKQALLKEHNITVWRFHDYWHMHQPDGIGYGVLKKAGWLKYVEKEKAIVNIPAIRFQELIDHLKKALGISSLRVIGNANQLCKKIAILPGAAGGQLQISIVEKEKPDVLIVGEVHEWETGEYIRDSQELGNNTSLIILGHAQSEEPGMEYLAEWLQPKIPGVKITHIPSGNPFRWV